MADEKTRDLYYMHQPEILVYQAHQKLDEEGRLTDAKTRGVSGEVSDGAGEWVRRFQQAE